MIQDGNVVATIFTLHLHILLLAQLVHTTVLSSEVVIAIIANHNASSSHYEHSVLGWQFSPFTGSLASQCGLTWICSSVSPFTTSSTGIEAAEHPLFATAVIDILRPRRRAFLTANMVLVTARLVKVENGMCVEGCLVVETSGLRLLAHAVLT